MSSTNIDEQLEDCSHSFIQLNKNTPKDILLIQHLFNNWFKSINMLHAYPYEPFLKANIDGFKGDVNGKLVILSLRPRTHGNM